MKNRVTAAIIALFFGWAGVHKFYLRDTGAGIFYLILMVIGNAAFRMPISAILGWIDAVVLFTMTDEKFDEKYNKNYADRYERRNDRYQRRNNYRSNERYSNRENYSRRNSGSYEVRRDTYRSANARPQPSRTPSRPRENPFKKTGISKYKEYDLEGAIEDFNKGLEIDAHDIALHFNLACAYSLTEKPEKGFYHLSKAVEYGFKDFERIKTHDDLAYLRIQDEFEQFQENGYRLEQESKTIPVTDASDGVTNSETIPEQILEDDILLSQLQKLSELRNKGLLSEKEYILEKEKLIRR